MTTSIENIDDKPKLTRLLPETDNNSKIFSWSPTPFRKGASIISDKKVSFIIVIFFLFI